MPTTASIVAAEAGIGGAALVVAVDFPPAVSAGFPVAAVDLGVVGLRVAGNHKINGSVKRPISALRVILRHCGVRKSTPSFLKDSQALISGALRIRRISDLLRVHQNEKPG
ncbi:hypothetical protein DESC_910031 [Desulfosarcina cetonica]|nr:hypothetical protein DESC_910031 [Desulfosarcina cetonica]